MNVHGKKNMKFPADTVGLNHAAESEEDNVPPSGSESEEDSDEEEEEESKNLFHFLNLHLFFIFKFISKFKSSSILHLFTNIIFLKHS